MTKSRLIRYTKTIISGIGIVGLGVVAKSFNVTQPRSSSGRELGENWFTLLENHITFASVVGMLVGRLT
jgi:hypothetical protein